MQLPHASTCVCPRLSIPRFRLLRFIVSIVFSVLFVSSLDVFLVGVACVPDPRGKGRWILYNFPAIHCYDMPHMVHAMVGVVMCVRIDSLFPPVSPHSRFSYLSLVRNSSIPRLMPNLSPRSLTIIGISFFISLADSEQNLRSSELLASFDSAYAMRRAFPLGVPRAAHAGRGALSLACVNCRDGQPSTYRPVYRESERL